jgi:hypothetical protein
VTLGHAFGFLGRVLVVDALDDFYCNNLAVSANRADTIFSHSIASIRPEATRCLYSSSLTVAAELVNTKWGGDRKSDQVRNSALDAASAANSVAYACWATTCSGGLIEWT